MSVTDEKELNTTEETSKTPKKTKTSDAVYDDTLKVTRTVSYAKPEDKKKKEKPAEPVKEEVKEEAKPVEPAKPAKAVYVSREEIVEDARAIIALADKGKATRNKLAMLKNVNEIVASIVPLDNRKFHPMYGKANFIKNSADKSKHIKFITKMLPHDEEYYSEKILENADKLAEYGINASKLQMNIQIVDAGYVFEFSDPSYYANLEENKARINAEVEAIKKEIKKAEELLSRKALKSVYKDLDCSSVSELRAFVRAYDEAFPKLRIPKVVVTEPKVEEVAKDDEEPKLSLGMQLLKAQKEKDNPQPAPVEEAKNEAPVEEAPKTEE